MSLKMRRSFVNLSGVSSLYYPGAFLWGEGECIAQGKRESARLLPSSPFFQIAPLDWFSLSHLELACLPLSIKQNFACCVLLLSKFVNTFQNNCQLIFTFRTRPWLVLTLKTRYILGSRWHWWRTPAGTCQTMNWRMNLSGEVNLVSFRPFFCKLLALKQ